MCGFGIRSRCRSSGRRGWRRERLCTKTSTLKRPRLRLPDGSVDQSTIIISSIQQGLRNRHLEICLLFPEIQVNPIGSIYNFHIFYGYFILPYILRRYDGAWHIKLKFSPHGYLIPSCRSWDSPFIAIFQGSSRNLLLGLLYPACKKGRGPTEPPEHSYWTSSRTNRGDGNISGTYLHVWALVCPQDWQNHFAILLGNSQSQSQAKFDRKFSKPRKKLFALYFCIESVDWKMW